MSTLMQAMAAAIEGLLPELESIYKDLHQHPELSMQEVRTARIAADYERIADLVEQRLRERIADVVEQRLRERK